MWLQLLVLIALLVPFSAWAILFDPLPIEMLSREADVVLQGKVLAKSCQRDGSGRIYTRVEVEVSELWKGTISGTPFVIVQGGGVLGEEQRVVSGQVQYDVGEEVVAFLVRNSRGEGVTLGMRQGKFHVWTTDGQKFAANPFHGAAQTLQRPQALQSDSGSAAGVTPLTVQALKRRVMEAAR